MTSDRLDSWKEIAAYLKRSVRTVTRWEREEGLPIHRHLHSKSGSVYAYKAELDAWWTNRGSEIDRSSSEMESPRPPRGRRAWLVVTAVVAQVGTVENTVSWTNTPGFAISADSRWLLYTSLESTDADLMLVDNFH